MGNILGGIAGGGMLILIGVLVLLFLHQVSLLPEALLRRIARTCGLTLGAGILYLLAGLLLDLALFQEDAVPEISAVFSNGYLDRVYAMLEQPSWQGPLTGAFVWAAHGLGRLLQEQYRFAALALAWALTCASACLIRERIRAVWGEAWAREGMFLLLCLPGAVFFFLPGFPPLLLFLFSLLFFFAGKRLGGRDVRPVRGSAFLAVLTGCAVLSAFITAALVLRKTI